MAWRSTSCCLLFLLCSLGFVPGCGPSGPQIMRVSGTVTRGGKPVEKLVVNFWPDHGRPSWGLTDREGRYTLHYDRDRDGAVPGLHKVWVQNKPGTPGE